jgi:hypothetical protein
MKGEAFTKTKLIPCQRCGRVVERDARITKATCFECKEGKAVQKKTTPSFPDATMKA